MKQSHIPVLEKEVIEALNIDEHKRYIDATLGAGGHTIAILKKGGKVLGLDQDQAALVLARKRIDEAFLDERKEHSVTLVLGNFGEIRTIAREHTFEDVDGVLFDLGVSSMQLDTPERGFSYRFTDAPLDLRMNPSGGDTAAQLVNRKSADELYEIFARFGEEQHSRSIADVICSARSIKPIQTTGDLIQIINTAVKGAQFDTYSRVFQALRMAVNDELGNLEKGLSGAKEVLKRGGRLVVISFHSIEDRKVKQFLQDAQAWRLVTKHPIVASDQERKANPRSRSAKLRIAEKL